MQEQDLYFDKWSLGEGDGVADQIVYGPASVDLLVVFYISEGC